MATTNEGKIRELSALLKADVRWRKLSEFDTHEVVEDGQSFAENAAKKALGYARQTGLLTIADDSGLVVDALDGAPGVKSARFSGEKNPDKTLLDHRNMAKVLELMKDVPDEERAARFVCHICLASPEKVLLAVEGKVEGWITREEKGEKGFGYDPIFYIPELKKTAAQLQQHEKNAVSHRGNAIRKLRPELDKLLKTMISSP